MCWKERIQVYRQRWWWSKLQSAPLNVSPQCLPSEIHVSPGWISLLRSSPFYKALAMLISQSKGFPHSANSYSAVLIMQVRYIAVLLLCNTLQISMHHVHNVWNISKFMLHSSFLWLLVSFSIIFLQQIDSPSKMHKCTLKWITLSRLLLLKSQVPLLLFTRNNCLNYFTFCSASTVYFLHSVSNSEERLNSTAWLSYCSTMEI